jgi:uncharacterized protein
MNRIIIFFTCLFAAVSANAQSAFTGIWEGKMNPGIEMRVVFYISQDSSKNYIATMEFPDQGMKDIKASKITVSNDSIRLEISKFGASYAGKLKGDSLITGTMKQGVSLPLNMKKVEKVSEIVRAQTPVPPFAYKSEDLVYTNKNKSISYGATITIPPGKGPFPAALLLTGSGSQNRDEEIVGHKPFAVIADHLTKNGFIVLRVDDRGMGKTTGDASIATTRDYANDAIASLEYLLQRPEVNKKKIGLIGHSEGGMIAQMVAAERKDINFVVLLAAPGEPTMKVMHDQNEAILRKSGMSKEYVAAYLELYGNILTTILAADSATAIAKVKPVVDEWINKTPKNIVMVTTGITNDSTKNNFVNVFVSQLNMPWIRYFLSYDPASYIKKISASVLALNGSKDVQVISKSNLPAIEAALKQSKSKNYEVKELEGLNHLFQECKSCTINDYGQLQQTISPAVLEIMTNWMKKR